MAVEAAVNRKLFRSFYIPILVALCSPDHPGIALYLNRGLIGFRTASVALYLNRRQPRFGRVSFTPESAAERQRAARGHGVSGLA
jgi:hypothetical protein